MIFMSVAGIHIAYNSYGNLFHCLSTHSFSSPSFGVVLWELLTGEKPYTGLNMFVVAYGVGHGTLSLPIPASCPTVLRELMTG